MSHVMESGFRQRAVKERVLTVSQLNLVHEPGAHVELLREGRPLFRYVHRPDVPQLESPKPYLHPVHTLAGDLVTAYRPHDHVWHKGIQLALPHVGPENFWGGVTWIRGRGYVQLPNNGSMRHADFEALDTDGSTARIVERLQWITEAGEHWIDERRTLGVRILDGAWLLSFSTDLSNRSGRDLPFGSPTTNGRPNAGYGGLLWRGPRCFTGGDVIGPGGVRGEEALMGARGPWVAYVGTQDETMRRNTVAFFDEADGPPWFVRSTPYAVAGPAPFFHEETTLPDGDSLTLRCDIAIADGAWDEEDVEAFRSGLLQEVAR
jgi:hypothetical protein